MTSAEGRSLAVDAFDRFHARVAGLPGERHTRPSTIVDTHPLTGETSTHVVQTYRQEPDGGFTLLVQRLDGAVAMRVVIPHKVCQAIYRQHAALVDRSTPESRRAAKEKRERLRKRQERADRKAARARATQAGGAR